MPVKLGTVHPDLCISRGGTPQYLKATANNPLSCPSPQPIQGRPGSELPPVAGSPLHLQPGEIRSQGWGGGCGGGEEGMRMTGSPQSVGLGSDPRPGVSKEETRAGHTATHIRAGRPGSLTRVFRSIFPEARSFCAFY